MDLALVFFDMAPNWLTGIYEIWTCILWMLNDNAHVFGFVRKICAIPSIFLKYIFVLVKHYHLIVHLSLFISRLFITKVIYGPCLRVIIDS